MAAGDFTVRDLIRLALIENGVVDARNPLEDEDAEQALIYLKHMVDAQDADRLLLFTVAPLSFVLTPNQQPTTIGEDGNFDTNLVPRPTSILGMTVIPVGASTEIPVVPYDRRQDYIAEPSKTLTDAYPRRFLYEPSWSPVTAKGCGSIFWWPIATTAATVKIWIPAPLQGSLTLDTVLGLPAGYLEAWRFNLAKRCCRPFQKALTPDLDEDARASLALLRRNNDPGPPRSHCELATTGGYFDIDTNRYRP